MGLGCLLDRGGLFRVVEAGQPASMLEEHQAAQCFFSIKSEVGSGRATRVALEKLAGRHRGPR